MAGRRNGSDAEESDEDTSFSRRSRKRVSYNEDEDLDDFEEEEEAEADVLADDSPAVIEEPAAIDEDVKPEADEDDEDIDDISSDEPPDKEEDYVDDGEDDEDNIRRRGRKRKRVTTVKRATSRLGSDDSDFKGDSEAGDDEIDEDSSEDDFVEKLQERRFVATDEEGGSDGDDYGYTSRRRGGRSNRRKKRVIRATSIEPKVLRSGRTISGIVEEEVEVEDGEEDTSIQKEIQELYDSSPSTTPVKHKLRERGARIDYTIPPPLNPDQPDDYSMYGNGYAQQAGRANSNGSVAGRRGRKPIKSDYRKILFPTAGPFGGSDVISLFGKNIPPGGIPIEGMTNTTVDAQGNLTAIGGAASDSDSSDDENVTGAQTAGSGAQLNGADKTINHTKLITSGTSTSKKKNNLSDTDPLGVDMNIDFSAVGGLSNYINQLKEMVALPLLYPELYQNFGLTPPRGVLFHGPPGTGKTLMARALAASCSTPERKITFFMRKGADCLSKWVGEAERQLRLLFEEAKNQQPSIIFFDEIDGLAPVRSSKQEQIHASIVSTLLALMDGMDNRGQVIVIGATNRPDSVDPALRRPGRFDREFYFPLPDLKARSEILQIHTKKWEPPLPSEFLDKVAGLTKGYGGADLRALCTEAALNSIQRKYPQIYQSDDKLKVNPKSVKVIARDFMKAVEKIVPSSARSTSSGSSPLPEHLKPLLTNTLSEISKKLRDLLPTSSSKITTLEEAQYYDPTINDKDGGFGKQELLRNLENSRICKPHLLICGEPGNGQQYLSSAILNELEGFQVQSLDMGNLFGDATRTPESSIVQAFVEARRHQPSVIFIPNIDIWFQVVPASARATLSALLRTLNSNEKILLLGVAETTMDMLDGDIKLIFGFNNNSTNNVTLHNPTRKQRTEYFSTLHNTILMKPYEFTNDLENRPRRKLKKLPKLEVTEKATDIAAQRKLQKEIEYQDTKLKNVLKLKLAGLMDLFKNRYKRFKKPIIDEALLYHLFEPSILDHDNPQHQFLNYDVLYVKSTDPQHENMIKELSSGRYYFNMDLEIIEERLWNGYYSEPKQFLKDIKMIVKDSITNGDRERILKANEMLTNAQFGIDDFSTPEFLNACKEMRSREIEKQEKILQEHKKAEEEFQRQQELNLEKVRLEQANGLLDSQVVEVDASGDINGNVNGAANDHMDTDRDEEVKLALDVKPAAEGTAAPAGTEVRIESLVSAEPANGTASIEPTESVPTAPVATKVEVTEPEAPVVPVAIEETVTETIKEVSSNGSDVKPASILEPVDIEMAAVEEDLSSESEIELLDHPDKQLTIDGRIDEFFNELLPELTENYGVEKLEIVMAKFMEIVWADRSKWDRRETISKLVEAAKDFSLTLN
ncbi:tat-binding homolog 7 [[Candida] railenensis]|uniref:Tat-binding homolog 7 n=1 Tax=[Candida] railenensis TaxID=45579 RepID=A0A9P0VZT3_9ASCO|nr:tat-binding homolog 7 [[Candida] railenensis]